MTDLPTPAETPFWRFSLHFYGHTGVSDACIALQDEHGVDVNLLLFLFWLAAAGRQLSADDVKCLDDTVRDWRNLTIIPIRDARRKLKGVATLVAPASRKLSAPRSKRSNSMPSDYSRKRCTNARIRTARHASFAARRGARQYRGL